MSRLILIIYRYPYTYFTYSRGIMREMKVIKVMVSAFYIAILLGGLMGKGSLHMFVNNFELRIKGDVVLY